MANLLDLSPDEFMFTLQEFGYAPERRDELIRQYREHNSVFGSLNRAAQERQAEIAGEGRRPVAGGFLSKPEGSLGMDAVRGLRVEPMAGLLGMLTGAGRAVEAPAAAYQGLIPMGDIPLEALGTAGMASLGGAAAVRPAGSVGMGGRVVGDESGAQTVARLLREGRQSEVTDDLLATLTPDDNAELFRLYNEGATGVDLPMDEASRMARAREAGFDTGLPLYHGTGADFQAFDAARFQQSDFGTGGAGVYSSESPGLAGAYADLVTRPSNDNANILPIVTRRQEAYDTGGYRNINNDEQAREYSQRMQDLGVDNVYYRDNMSGEIVENVTFDPRNIRSRFARFDPRLSDNANLLAANRDQTVGLLSTAAAAEPRNAAERMARDILDMRAAGRAGEVTDEMMAQADPQYMFANTPLPMDDASRMARAREAGFDTGVPLYHGGRDNLQNVSRFKGNAEGGAGTFYMTDERSVANSYAPNRPNPSGENVMPLLARSGDYREAGYTRPFPANGTPQEIDAWLSGNDAYNERMSAEGIKSAVYNQQIDAARRNNQTGVVMRQTADNRIDTPFAIPSDVFIALDPSNIRSRFARFDPEFAHLANLSAANIDPLAGLFGALAAEEQRRQRNSQ
jgi:hypothetical protein